jgi:hypothetical protein
MGYTYSVTITNHSSHPNYFMLYQNDPTSWSPVGQSYTIEKTAAGHSFVISTVAPGAAGDCGPLDTTNGTLNVGTSSDDDDGGSGVHE